jgi:branched-chain amino acid transport system substrate-binding protein
MILLKGLLLMRQSLFSLFASVFLCTALAACASTTAVKTPEVVQAPPPPAAVEDPAQAREKAEAARLRIAVLAPMTGEPSQARLGQSLANAAALAIQELGSRQLRLSVYDTAGGAEGAARKAINEGAHIILGPLLSSETQLVAPIARAAKVPVVSFSNDAAIAQDGVLLMGFQPDQAIERVVAYAAKRGISQFAALTPQGRYGQTANEAFFGAVRSAGGRIVAAESYERPKSAAERNKLLPAARRVSRYEQRLAAARAAVKPNPDGTIPVVSTQIAPPPFQAILIADTYGWARAFAPTLRTFGVESPAIRFLGTELWTTDRTVGQDQQLVGAWFASVPDFQFDAMARRYVQLYGARPPRIASFGYDGVLLAASAVSRWKPGEPFPARVLRDGDGFTGIDGLFRFDAKGIAERGMQVQEVTGTGVRLVSSAPTSFGPAQVSWTVDPKFAVN